MPGGVQLAPGQSTTGQTVTINDPNGQTINYTTEVSGMPPAASAPVFDSTPVTSVTAGHTSIRTRHQAHDPDGSTPGFVLGDGPAGHDGRIRSRGLSPGRPRPQARRP